MEPSFFERVYRVVKRIPRGKVASYGQIAALLGQPRAARTVGWALASMTAEQAAEVPWQRVINHAGRISIARADLSADVQQSLLEGEGVRFDETGHVDWRVHRWHGLEWYEIEELWQDDGETGEDDDVERSAPNA